MNPMANADNGASHAILPQTALFDSKSAKPVTLRPAAGEINAAEAHQEIFAEHVTIPLCPLGRVIQKLQLTAIWTTPDFDSQLCQQIRKSARLDATSD